MQNEIRKTENNQIPSVQGGAEQNQIDVDDVNYAIRKISVYEDEYSKCVASIFRSYLIHQDFSKMKSELELAPKPSLVSVGIWEFNTYSGFLEVIYPSPKKGVENGN